MGIKVEGDGEWSARKPGGPRKRLWRKLHLGMDEETLEIPASEATSSIEVAPVPVDLLNRAPPNEKTGRATADTAHDVRKRLDAIVERDANAVILPGKNAKLWKPNRPGGKARNEGARLSKYLRKLLLWQPTGYVLEHNAKNRNHLTLPESKDFNALDDLRCFGYFA